jgi:hypothetical protein
VNRTFTRQEIKKWPASPSVSADPINLFLPPAAWGALFEKTAPLDPRQKLLIKSCAWVFYFFFAILPS